VRRLAKAVDGAAGAAAALLAEHALPALEAAAFQLGELAGLAACARWAAPLGLQARARPRARPGARGLCRVYENGGAHGGQRRPRRAPPRLTRGLSSPAGRFPRWHAAVLHAGTCMPGSCPCRAGRSACAGVEGAWLQPGRGARAPGCSRAGARDPRGALHPVRVRAQEAPVAAADAQAAAQLVRAEALRRRVVGTAAEYRRLFDWLLQTVRRLNDDAPAAAGAAARPAPDAPRLAAFLRGQFRTDALAPLLAAEARRRAALCPLLADPARSLWLSLRRQAERLCHEVSWCMRAFKRTWGTLCGADDGPMRPGARGPSRRARPPRARPPTVCAWRSPGGGRRRERRRAGSRGRPARGRL